MSELIIAEAKTERVKELKQLRCSKCGVTTDAACDCGVGYVPAHEFAAKALEANPEMSEMSDNAIAEVIGVDHKTVGKARKSVRGNSLTAKRTGRDGKKYPATRSKRHAQPATTPAEMQPELTALLLTQIEQLVGKLVLAVEHRVHSDALDGRVRAVTDQLLALIVSNN